ncbi:protein ALP1-like [Patiria miniata]|uniref:DDE Tnp4 domain-containing protein n=1 Tax=Patiria miniata TaxID=46514 RepID=A0A913ZW81_PATMI|nr:protein ALP1-like [Patiria miniata]
MCGGAIDGTHIPIIAPDQYHTDYFNRKGWYSVLLQGLVDHNFKFMDFDVGQPGKCHDSWVFQSSKLHLKLVNGTFYPRLTRAIEGQDIPVVILGDSAYTLSPFLMKPYPEGLATAEELRFNVRLSRAHILVEHAFGRLKGRWRCIMKRNDSHAKNIHVLVSACIVLHNFCETWKQENEDMHIRDEPQDDDPFEHQADHAQNIAEDGEQFRAALARYFTSHH